METRCVFFEVGTELLNIIKINFVLQTFHTPLTRRTSGQSLGTFKQSDALSLSPPHRNKVSQFSPQNFLFAPLLNCH
jgi:hypothetical protein